MPGQVCGDRSRGHPTIKGNATAPAGVAQLCTSSATMAFVEVNRTPARSILRQRHRFGYLVHRTAGITDNLNESHFFRQHRLDKMAVPRRPALTGYF